MNIPEFRPHPLFRSGHSQTLVGAWLPAWTTSSRLTVRHFVALPDGDQLVIHDDAPPNWDAGAPVVLLVHGLGGSSESPCVRRTAVKLRLRGLRTLRLDLRGVGAGHGLARLPYHAGCSDDLAVTAELIEQLFPRSPLLAVGFSLGGNILLKWLAESAAMGAARVERAVAVNPPLDLAACSAHVGNSIGGLYDRYFARMMYKQASGTPDWLTGTLLDGGAPRPAGILAFDEQFTAPKIGFASAADYYARCSAGPLLEAIRVSTLILSACDDPLVPRQIFEQTPRSDAVKVHLAAGGGHLGYFGSKGIDPDRWWMDWRIVDWLCFAGSTPRRSQVPPPHIPVQPLSERRDEPGEELERLVECS